MTLDLTPTDAELLLFQRLNAHVEKQQLTLAQFWKTNRLCLSLQEFLQLLQNAQFKITSQELNALQAQVEFVNLAALIEGVDMWKNQEISVANFITKQEEHTLPIKPQPAFSKFGLPLKSNSQTTPKPKSATSKQLQAQLKLTQALVQAKNETDYELTIKVGEINDICKQLKNSLTYLIHPNEHNTFLVEINQKTGQQTSLKPKQFQKKYVQIKSALLHQGEQFQGTLEQDLKKTLVEVMCLSDQLEEQIKLLENKGITH